MTINSQTHVSERLEHTNWGILSPQGYVLGIDLGGYGLRAALLDLHQHTCSSDMRVPSSNDPETIIAETLDLCRTLLEREQVDANRLIRVGVGFGGPVDSDAGIVLLSPRLSGWDRFPLRERFEDAFDAATLIDNDANLIAKAEATFGVGRNVNNLFYLHLSTGVGGGIVLDGHLFHGATGIAGEIGHTFFPSKDGTYTTLEDRVSIGGLLKRASELGLQTDNLEHLFDGSTVGQQVIEEAVDLLAVSLAQVVGLLDPEMIVLGGVVARIGGDSFVQAVQERIQRYMHPQFVRPIPVMASKLGTTSIALGGVALALESISE
jgi:glucokinase